MPMVAQMLAEEVKQAAATNPAPAPSKTEIDINEAFRTLLATNPR